MNKKIKVLSIENIFPTIDNNFLITKGNWYYVEKETDEEYLINSNIDHTFKFYKKNFRTEQQIRKDKLQKINDSRKNQKRSNL